MPPFTGNMWRYDPEPIAGPRVTSVNTRLGELPPYPCLQSNLRLVRSYVPTRDSQAVSENFESDVEYIFWDAYDKMAPVEHRKKITDSHLCQRDGPGLQSCHRVGTHARGTQHQGNDRLGGTHLVGGHSNPINVQPAALGFPSMELFEDFSPGPCSSSNYSAIQSDRPAETQVELFLEPEMLLQPEERPMSHEELVLEANKIYSGMKCGIPEYDSTAEEDVPLEDIQKKPLYDRYDSTAEEDVPLRDIQEKPLYDRYDFSVNTVRLANTSTSKTIPANSKTPQTCEPSIASNFGGLGVLLAFNIIQFFGQESRPMDTEKDTKNAVNVRKRTFLMNDWWQSLIAMPNRLLHEHLDFFLAFNHPGASIALRKVVAKYSETPLACEEFWTKCLGDLEHDRMAIDEDEPSSRRVWSDVTNCWYNNTADSSPRIDRPRTNSCTKYRHEKLDDRLEAHDSTISVSEADHRGPVKLKKPQTGRIRERPLGVAQLETTEQNPLSPAAVEFNDIDYSKEHVSVNVKPLSPITRSLQDLNDSKEYNSVHTRNLALSPGSLSAFVAFPSNTYSTTLPAPVPCTQLKEGLSFRRSMRLYRCIRPCHILIALGFITIVGSLAPAIWRSTNRNDISGGFSLGQYILGAGVFVIGSIVVIHSKTCTCWK